MKINLILSVLLLLTASAARVSAEPMLKANPNPVIVPAGQTRGATTLAWNTEGADGFIWVSVDGGADTQLHEAGGVERTLLATVEVGKSYAFKLYTADKALLASVTVTVVVQQATAQPSSSLRPVRKDFPYALTPKLVNDGSPFMLICRGGSGLRVSIIGGGTNIGSAITGWPVGNPFVLLIDFSLSTQPPDHSGSNLQPGQCSPSEFPLRDSDPAEVRAIFNEDGSLPGAGLYPWEEPHQNYYIDPRRTKFREYLKDPKNYWLFAVKDSSEGYLKADLSRYWKPEFYYRGLKVGPVDPKRINKDVLTPKKPE